MDMGLYNKFGEPRGTHGTLIGNWLEERALQQASGFSRYQPYNENKRSLPHTNLRIIEHTANADKPGQKVSVNTSTYRAPSHEAYGDKFFNLNSYQKQEIATNNDPLPKKCSPATQTFHLFKNYHNVHDPHKRTTYDASYLERENCSPDDRPNTIPNRTETVPWYSSVPYQAEINPSNGPHNSSAYEVRPAYELGGPVPPKPVGLFETRRIATRRYQM